MCFIELVDYNENMAKEKLLRKLLVLVVLRRVPKLLLLLQLKLLQLKNQKLNQLNNFTVILIHIKGYSYG